MPKFGLVKAGRGCFDDHIFGGWFKGDKDADLRPFTLDDAAQVAHRGAVAMPGVIFEEQVVGSGGVERLVEVDQVHRFGGHGAQDGEVVAVVKGVGHGRAPGDGVWGEE